MSPRTKDGIVGATRMVALIGAVSPERAVEFADHLTSRLDPASPVYHPLRLAAEAAEQAAGTLLADRAVTR